MRALRLCTRGQWRNLKLDGDLAGESDACGGPEKGGYGGKKLSMVDRERRNQEAQAQAATLRAGLSPEQIRALGTLEAFRWTLRFVRRPMFLDPIPVVFSPQGDRFVILEADGTINENPGFKLRPE